MEISEARSTKTFYIVVYATSETISIPQSSLFELNFTNAYLNTTNNSFHSMSAPFIKFLRHFTNS